MSLVAYTITALERDVADATASGKQIVIGASCSMYSQPADTVVTLYDDAAGSNGSTAKTTGTNGQVVVYIEPGEYRVSVNGIDSFVTIGGIARITTVDLIALDNASSVGDVVETTGYSVAGDGGGAKWLRVAATGTTSQTPAQLGDALLNDASGGQWRCTDRPIKVQSMGATPISESPTTDSSPEIQAAVWAFKNPSLTNIESVISSGDATREIYGNVIDFGGNQYLLKSPIDYSLSHGIHFKNGSVIADSESSFVAGEALIQNQDNFCINPKFSDFVIECNGVTNGLFMERCIYGVVDNLRVYGWESQEYGTKAGSATLGYTTNIVFNDYKAWGTIAAETVDALTATGTGLIITDSDCEVTGGEISRGLIGLSLSSAGSIRGMHFTGNGNNNAVGAYIAGVTQQKLIDCYFDNTILELEGFRENTVIGNMFANSGGVESTQAIKINSVKADDDVADCIILGNRANLANVSSFISLDETAGSFLNIGQTKVTDNVCRASSALSPVPTQETQGVIVVSVNDTDFNGLAVEVDLSDRLLFADAPNASFSGSVTAAPNTLAATPYCKGTLYNAATQTLTVLFSERYGGKFSIAYSWGSQDNQLSAVLPASAVTSAHHSFSAYLSSNALNATGDSTVYAIPFNSERYDNGSIFDTVAGEAIIKTGGVYTIDAQVMIDGMSSATDVLLKVTAGSRVLEDRQAGSFTGQKSMRVSGGVMLNAGDTISCTIMVDGNGSDNITVNGSGDYRTYLSAMLMP